MAKTLVKLSNGLRVKYLIRPKKFYLLFGNEHIQIAAARQYNNGFATQQEAEDFGNKLFKGHLYWFINGSTQ